MQRVLMPMRAAFFAAVLAALYPFPAAAIAARNAYTQSATPEMKAEMERLREQAKEDRFDKSIAEAKLEVIAAGKSTLAIILTCFGFLNTVLLFSFGFLTYRKAAFEATKAVREEFKEYKEDIQKSLEIAKTKTAEIGGQHAKAHELTQGLQDRVNTPPSSTPSEAPLPDEQLQELKGAARAAADTPRKERTAQDFRVLMYKASSEAGWQDYAELADGMAFLHGNDPDDLAFALFGKAFGQSMLNNHELAAILWADYMQRCAYDDTERRADALNNWGNALLEQANTKIGDAADALFVQAYDKYAAALAIKPDKHLALNNWGYSLSKQAQTKQGDAADALYARASEKYAAALAIKPDDHVALFNWGVGLTDQAQTNQGEAANALFAQAGEKYAAVLIIKPNYHEALFNWGHSLSEQASIKHGDEADALFAQACDKYAAAIAIKPDAHEALNSWGATLINQASTRDGDERLDLLSQAEGKLLQAETLRAGSAAYNLACLYGLRGDAGSAAGWLRKAKAANIRCPDCESIAKEIDFDAVRNAPEFVQALADIGC